MRVSEFLRASGVIFDNQDGLLHRDASTASASTQLQPVVLNRVVEISEQTLRAIDGGAELLTRGQVTSAFLDALSTYPKVIGAPGVCSPVGSLMPLVNQWKLMGLMAHRTPCIKTPAFKYGYGPEPIDHLPFERPIWKSAFDLYSWKVSEVAPHVHWDSLVINRPEGDPLLLYFCGHAWAAQFLSSNQNQALPDDLQEPLRELVPCLKDTFGAFAGECLLFVAGSSRLVFASFSHYLSAASRTAFFVPIVREGLRAELSLSSLATHDLLPCERQR